jgi:Tfp pilus assembly protein PilE
MAGSKLNNGHKLRASTLLEVIISMIIIIVVFGIAMMIFANVNRLSLSAKKLRAQAILQETLFQAERTGNHMDQTVTVDDISIRQKVSPFQNEPELLIITLTAFDINNEQIAQLKKIIAFHEDQP